jgi:hypothetical protein
MPRRLVAVLTALVTTLTLAGCGALRLESEDPPTQSAGAEEQLRQEHAVQTWRLAELARSAATTDPEHAAVLESVAQDALVQLETLGGVWKPSGRHLQPASPRGDATAVLEALTASADAALQSSIDGDGELAQMFAGIAVSRSLRADQLTVSLGSEPDAVEPALPAAIDPATSADLVRTLDALGQAWEVVAARSEDPTTPSEQARSRREEAQQLAELAGVADAPDDPRAVSYDLGTDLAATIADLRADLVPCWLLQVGTTTGEDRRAVIDLALAAARDAGLSEVGADIPAIVGTSVA